MAVGKKKYAGKSNGSVRKVVSNTFSREKQVIIVLISLVVLIAVVAVLYPMLKEKGVTGKAGTPPSLSDGACGGPGHEGYVIGKPTYSVTEPRLCVESSKSQTCAAANMGFIKNINNADVLCSKDSSSNLVWVECTIDGSMVTSGASKYSPVSLWGSNYLCAQNGNIESWFICPSILKVGTDGATDEFVSTSKGDYVCDQQWKKCSKNGDTALGGKYVCDGTKWKLSGLAVPPAGSSTVPQNFCTIDTVGAAQIIGDQDVICVDAIGAISECTTQNVGLIKNINGQFDVLCKKEQGGSQKWEECNADGKKSSSGDTTVSSEIAQGVYVCAQNGKYESWQVCTKDQTSPPNGEGVYVSKGAIAGSQSQFLCYSFSDETKWISCIPGFVEFLSDAGDDVLKYSCWDEKWHDCTLPENNGVVGKNKINYCDGTQWVNCDSSAVGISSNDKYYCAGNNFWQECKTENSFSSDYKALCKAGKWQALPEAVVPPVGYDWSENGAPVLESTVEEGQVVYLNTRSDATVKTDTSKKYYCPSVQYCPAGSYNVGENVDYCYAENSILASLGQSAFLCTLEKNQAVLTTCSSTLPAEYKLYKNKYLCVAKSGTPALWNKCDQDKVSGEKNEYHCDPATSTWTKCTTSLEGMATLNENFVCLSGGWTSTFKVGVDKNNLFEVRVPEVGKSKNITVGGTTLKNIDLCDVGTENIKYKATVCSNQKPTVSVPSLHFLQGSNQNLLVDEKTNILTVYDEADQKSVSLIKIIHPQDQQVLISETVLANNFKAGRRLAVEVDGDYYLLTQVPAGSLDLSKLQLLSLPSQSPVPFTILASDKYQFEIQAKKVLTLTYDGKALIVAVGKPTQALAGQVTQHNLAGEYEVVFSKEKPVLLQDFNDVKLVPCLSDKPADPLTLQVCLDESSQIPFVTLQRDVLTEAALNDGITDVPIALLYSWDETSKSKQASVFYLKLLDGSTTDIPTELQYEDFVDNLVTGGKRVALKFVGGLYLANHDGNVLSLPKINLTSYSEGDKTNYGSGSQSEKTVDFLVNGGKITLSRQLISPPPPFTVSVLTTKELLANPLNLENELSTSFSSEVPVMITDPVNYGILSRDTTSQNPDVLGFKPLFKVKGDATGQQQRLLQFQKPLVDGAVVHKFTLLYYYSAEQKGGGLVKSARVYYYYNLTDGFEDTHTFDDMFLDTFMGEGRELALGFGNGYYVLGYIGATPTQKSFFEFEKLVLTSLDGTKKFTPTVDGLQASFTIPEGEINVAVDTDVTQMIFSGQGAAELQKTAEEKSTQAAKEAATVEFDSVKDFKFVLNSGQIVDINGVKYEICDKDVYVSVITDKVNLCKNGQVFTLSNGKTSILKENEFVKDGDLLLQYTKSIENGKVKKIITFWQAFNLGLTPAFSWLQLTTNFENKQFPALFWNKEWYELSGASPALEDLEMTSLNGTGNCDVKVYPGEQGKQSGKISCQSSQTKFPHLLDIKQQLVKDDIIFTITPTDDKLVTTTPFNVSDTMMIIPSLDKPDVYKLDVNHLPILDSLSLVTLSVSTTDDQLLTWIILPKDATKTILLPNGETINVNVLEDPKTKLLIVAVSK